MAEHMYSAEEAAQILGLQVRTVRNYLREGRLPGVRIGKQYRIARSDLEAFTSGGVTLDAIIGAQAEPAARSGRARITAAVSSVVEIMEIDAAGRESLERTLTAVLLAGSAAGSKLRVEPLYDEARRRLKLIVVGEAGETSELLRIIDRFTADGGHAPGRPSGGGPSGGGPSASPPRDPLNQPGSRAAW